MTMVLAVKGMVMIVVVMVVVRMKVMVVEMMVTIDELFALVPHVMKSWQGCFLASSLLEVAMLSQVRVPRHMGVP